MSIKKTPSGWLVDIQPGGRGAKRFRKTFTTKAEALAWEAWVKTQIIQTPEWMPPKRDKRKLSDLVDLWHQHHGQHLKSKNTLPKLKNLCKAMGNPFADDFNSEQFSAYRARRLDAGISANFINRDHAYLRAVFNELKRLGYWNKENPLSKIRQFKIEEKELAYLTQSQIRQLLGCLSDDALHITKICLSTGARWSEAESLKATQVRDGMIHLSRTKSGKNRSIPIDEALYTELANLKPKTLGGNIFKPAYNQFRKAVEKSHLQLPKGQLSHVLRHTFASHFMMNGGNILVLQRLLGHSTLAMTMRYAHMAPDHLQEAKTLNPLAKLTQC
ncbi:tyrosine-type recombinase/integrase [Methylobacillus caricis]|uniref:phage integrase n=1 Tax=Methylobacillus caricis TaxID=1971611 RepID=UPI001CFF851F|nr:tyrosine-type recombinase/integrase [Methylobacillus caricis]MCB5187590.1 tyrosine-type recombinase/integrase [Methylobacillus caricis]